MSKQEIINSITALANLLIAMSEVDFNKKVYEEIEIKLLELIKSL